MAFKQAELLNQGLSLKSAPQYKVPLGGAVWGTGLCQGSARGSLAGLAQTRESFLSTLSPLLRLGTVEARELGECICQGEELEGDSSWRPS